MYYTDQAVELAAQSVAVEDPTLRDALAPEDMRSSRSHRPPPGTAHRNLLVTTNQR